MLLQRWWDLEDCVSKLTRFIFNSTLQQCTKVPRAMSHNNLEPQHKNAWGLTRHTSIKLSLSSLYCHPTKDNTQLDSKQSSDFNHFSIILNHETKDTPSTNCQHATLLLFSFWSKNFPWSRLLKYLTSQVLNYQDIAPFPTLQQSILVTWQQKNPLSCYIINQAKRWIWPSYTLVLTVGILYNCKGT